MVLCAGDISNRGIKEMRPSTPEKRIEGPFCVVRPAISWTFLIAPKMLDSLVFPFKYI